MSRAVLIYLTRHGETTANSTRPRILAGKGDNSQLNDTGRRQAAWARDRLAERSLAAAYASPLDRAMDTARIIAGPHGLEVEADPGLIENDCGRWEHQSWEWIMAHDREAYDRWMERADIHPYPEGETFTEVADRFSAAMAEIAGRHIGEEILIVAHNTVNKTFLARCLGLPMHLARAIPYANCGLSAIEFQPAKGFKVRTVNFAEKYF
ncbi:histidine phosphatase family protein [Planctomycetota bacterium]